MQSLDLIGQKHIDIFSEKGIPFSEFSIVSIGILERLKQAQYSMSIEVILQI